MMIIRPTAQLTPTAIQIVLLLSGGPFLMFPLNINCTSRKSRAASIAPPVALWICNTTVTSANVFLLLAMVKLMDLLHSPSAKCMLPDEGQRRLLIA